jgi:hypothetical protein
VIPDRCTRRGRTSNDHPSNPDLDATRGLAAGCHA